MGTGMDGRRLPENMVIKILERLPVKSLVRFHSASKFWCALIKSPTFINCHLRAESKNGTVLLMRRHLRLVDADVLSFHDINSQQLTEVCQNLPIPFLRDIKYKYNKTYQYEGIYLLGPCNGIICIVCDECFIFCNPALREFKRLPPCPNLCPQDYEPSTLGHGFGNIGIQDFKVVLIRIIEPTNYQGQDSRFTVHLYSSSTNSWKELTEDPVFMPYIAHYHCSEVFFNGACHWNADTSGDMCFLDIVLAFDLATEAFSQMEYPDCLKELDDYQPCLMVLHEHLSLIRFKKRKTEYLDVWVMQEYGIKESWIKKFRLGPCIIIRALNSWKNDECLLVETSDGQLASFSFETNNTMAFEVYGSEESLRSKLWKESLISLNSLY